MKKSIVRSVLLVSVFAFLSACTQAPQPTTIEKILSEKTIVVGTTGEQFPFSYKDNKGELSGIDIKIARNLADELGVGLTFKIMPFDQLIPAVKGGGVDIVFSGVSITAQRNTEVAFPGIYYKSGKSIVTSNQKIYKGKVEDVNNEDVTLAVVKATTSEAFVQVKYPKAKLESSETFEAAIALLNSGKVDGMVTDYETAELISFAYLGKGYLFKNLSSKTEQEFISPVVSGDDALFINLVSNYITKINAFDEYSAIDRIWVDYLN